MSEVARRVVIPDGIVTTAWPRVVAKCREVGVEFDQWQHGVGQIALGKRKNGKYAATVGGVVLSIPRQVGKTFLVGMIVIALCLLNPKLTVLWTAQRERTFTRTFQSFQSIVQRKKIRPFLAPTRNEGLRTTNGQQEIRFRNGSVILFGSRDNGFGRGFEEVDIEVFDEAQHLTERALEDMVPAANQSHQKSGALLFFMGTPPRPVDHGEEFINRRLDALSGESHDIAYIEFSADVDADPDDHAQWRKANPSYPKRTPLESMLRMRKNLTNEDSFKREALGIWDAADSARVIDEESWARVADPASMPVERLTLAIDVAPDRSMAAVGFAGKRADGLWHVELDDHRPKTEWIVPWVKARVEKNQIHAVVADELSGMVEKIRDRYFLIGTKIPVTVAGAEGRDMAIACGRFFDSVVDGSLRQAGQPQVDVALSVARKRPVAGAWAWNRRDALSDITPVVAETLALWGAMNENAKRASVWVDTRTAVVY